MIEALRKIIGWMPALIEAAGVTVSLGILSVVLGTIGGLFLALGRISKVPAIDFACRSYIYFFRGTPLIMQLFFIYFALPQTPLNIRIDSMFVAALIAFSLNSAAYSAEILRAAIQSIDKGQLEAAKSLGMSYPQAMRRIIIPQSYRRLIPPIGNEFIMVLKDTAIVSSIGMDELMRKTSKIQTASAQPLVYLPSMVIYLILTAIFSYIFKKLEAKHSVYE